MTRLDQPLDGIGVLDLSGGVSGPFCAQLLLWLGARVARVTGPEPDLLDALGVGVDSMGRALGDYVNAGKETVAAAITGEFEHLALSRLPHTDVVVTDWTTDQWPTGALFAAPRSLNSHPGSWWYR